MICRPEAIGGERGSSSMPIDIGRHVRDGPGALGSTVFEQCFKTCLRVGEGRVSGRMPLLSHARQRSSIRGAVLPLSDADKAVVEDWLITQFVGSPTTVADRLENSQKLTAADELVITGVTIGTRIACVRTSCSPGNGDYPHYWQREIAAICGQLSSRSSQIERG